MNFRYTQTDTSVSLISLIVVAKTYVDFFSTKAFLESFCLFWYIICITLIWFVTRYSITMYYTPRTFLNLQLVFDESIQLYYDSVIITIKLICSFEYYNVFEETVKYPGNEHYATRRHISGLEQDCSNPNALAMGLRLSCAKPSVCLNIKFVAIALTMTLINVNL